MLVNVRQRVYKTLDGQGYFSDSVLPVEGELGSGMFDKNGKGGIVAQQLPTLDNSSLVARMLCSLRKKIVPP